MNKFIPGFRFYRMADGEGAGGGTAAAAAVGTSATTTTGADGKSTTVGDAAAASQQNNSATATVAAVGTGTDTTTAAPDFKTSLGEFGKDPMFADFKDVAGLAKSYAETKKLVGQKLGIPGADATPEAKAAFYKALGVPDTAEGYALKAPDGLPDNVKEFYDKDALSGFGKIAKEINLTPVQAQALQKWNDSAMMEVLKKVTDDVTRSDADFDKVATTTFGDKKEAVMAQAQTDIIKYAPAELRKFAEQLPNNMLALVAATVTGIRKELGGEDKTITNDTTAAGGQSPGQLRAEARRLMALPEYSNPFAKGKEAHEALQKQVKGIYAQVAELEKQGVKKK